MRVWQALCCAVLVASVCGTSAAPRRSAQELAGELSGSPVFMQVAEQLREGTPAVQIAEYVKEVLHLVMGYLKTAAEHRGRAEAAFKIQVGQIDVVLEAALQEKREAAACVDAEQSHIDQVMERADARRAELENPESAEALRHLEALEAERHETTLSHRKALNTHEQQMQHLSYVQNLLSDIKHMVRKHREGKVGTAEVAAALVELSSRSQVARHSLAQRGLEPFSLEQAQQDARSVGSRLEDLLHELGQSFDKQLTEVQALHEATRTLHTKRMAEIDEVAEQHRQKVAAHRAAADAIHASVSELRASAEEASSRRASCETRHLAAERKVDTLQAQRDRLAMVAEQELKHYDDAIAEMEHQMALGREIIHLMSSAVEEAHISDSNPLAAIEADLPSDDAVLAVVHDAEQLSALAVAQAAKQIAEEEERARVEEQALKASVTGATGMAATGAAEEQQGGATQDLLGDLAEQPTVNVNEDGDKVFVTESSEMPAAVDAEIAAARERAEAEAAEERAMAAEVERLSAAEQEKKLRERMILGLKQSLNEEVTEELREAIHAPPVVINRPRPHSEPAATGATGGSDSGDSVDSVDSVDSAIAELSPAEREELEATTEETTDALRAAMQASSAAVSSSEQVSAEEIAQAAAPTSEELASESAAVEDAAAAAEAAAKQLTPEDAVNPDEYTEGTVGIVRAALMFKGATAAAFDATAQWRLARAISKVLGVHADSVRLTTIVEVSVASGEVTHTVLGDSSDAQVAAPAGRRLLALRGRRAALAAETTTNVVVAFDVQVTTKAADEAAALLMSASQDGLLRAMLHEEQFMFEFEWHHEPSPTIVPVLFAKDAAPAPAPVEVAAPVDRIVERIVEVPKDCPACKNHTVEHVVHEVIVTRNVTVERLVEDWKAREEAALARLEADKLKHDLLSVREDFEDKLQQADADLQKKLAEQRTALDEERAALLRNVTEQYEKRHEELEEARAKAEEAAREARLAKEEQATKHDAEIEQRVQRILAESHTREAEHAVLADEDARMRAQREAHRLEQEKLTALAAEKQRSAMDAAQLADEARLAMEKAVREAETREEMEAARRVYEVKQAAADAIQAEHAKVLAQIEQLQRAQEANEELERQNKELRERLEAMAAAADQVPDFEDELSPSVEAGPGEVVQVESVPNPDLEAAESDLEAARRAVQETQAEVSSIESEMEELRRLAAGETSFLQMDDTPDELGASSVEVQERAFAMLQTARDGGVADSSLEDLLSDYTGATGLFGEANSGVAALQSVQSMTGLDVLEEGLESLTPGIVDTHMREAAEAAAGKDAAARIQHQAEIAARIAILEAKLREAHERLVSTEERARLAQEKLDYERRRAQERLEAAETLHYAKKAKLDEKKRLTLAAYFKRMEAKRAAEHAALMKEMREKIAEAEQAKAEADALKTRMGEYHEHIKQSADEVTHAHQQLAAQREQAELEAQSVLDAAKAKAQALETEAAAKQVECNALQAATSEGCAVADT